MSKFVLDPRAVEDLDQIWLYIAENASPTTADHVEARFFEIFHQLAESPRIGHPRPDYTTAPMLFWPVYDYLIAYLPEPIPLRILAIVHGCREPRNISRILEDR